MDKQPLKNILEALLMTAEKPLSLEKMQRVFPEHEKPHKKTLILALEALAKEYEGRAIELKCLASGYCIQTRTAYQEWIAKQWSEKPSKYSRAALETLAIIAYKQPVTRAEIEAIRGVAVNSAILKLFQEREWIKVAAYKDVPGKPALYVTTKAFLDYFNLKSIEELPELLSAKANNEPVE